MAAPAASIAGAYRILRPPLVPMKRCSCAEIGRSRWPVSTLAASYSEVFETTVQILSELVAADLEWVLWRCAAGTYRLDL